MAHIRYEPPLELVGVFKFPVCLLKFPCTLQDLFFKIVPQIFKLFLLLFDRACEVLFPLRGC